MDKRENYLGVLRVIDLFSDFSNEELNQLFRASQYKVSEYEKGQIIYLQNEICHSMDIILSGKVAVQNVDEEGNILTIENFAAMDILGANLVFSSRSNYPMTIVAEADTLIMQMPEELILRLVASNHCFTQKLLRAISDRALILSDKIASISYKTIREQLVSFLTYEYHLQNCRVIKLNLTKKELAERLGIQRSSLGRELKKMREEGLLEYDARTITLKKIFLDLC